MSIEEMKKWIKVHDLASQVVELTGGSTNAEEISAAVEYVYDSHTLSRQEFISKYFGDTGK